MGLFLFRLCLGISRQSQSHSASAGACQTYSSSCVSPLWVQCALLGLGVLFLFGPFLSCVWAAKWGESTAAALLKRAIFNALHAHVPAGMSSRRRCAGGGSSRSGKSVRPESRRRQRLRWVWRTITESSTQVSHRIRWTLVVVVFPRCSHSQSHGAGGLQPQPAQADAQGIHAAASSSQSQNQRRCLQLPLVACLLSAIATAASTCPCLPVCCTGQRGQARGRRRQGGSGRSRRAPKR